MFLSLEINDHCSLRRHNDVSMLYCENTLIYLLASLAHFLRSFVTCPPSSYLQINIVEVISDTLYSDSEAVIDAAAELLETLLKKNDEDAAKMESVSLINSFMQGAGTGAAGIAMAQAEESMKREDADREAILSELVSAIGLQRFRFADAVQSEGELRYCSEDKYGEISWLFGIFFL